MPQKKADNSAESSHTSQEEKNSSPQPELHEGQGDHSENKEEEPSHEEVSHSSKRKRSFDESHGDHEDTADTDSHDAKELSAAAPSHSQHQQASNSSADGSATVKKLKVEEKSHSHDHEHTAAPSAQHHSAPPSGSKPAGWGITVDEPNRMVIEVPPDKVGQIIGSKGMIIQDIQNRTNSVAVVHQNFPAGVNRQIELKGTSQQMHAAYELIKRIIEAGPTAIHVNSLAGGPEVTKVIECTQPQVGRIIGTNGATIKDIQAKSGAKIQIEQDFPPDVPRKINISGSQLAVNNASQLITTLMNSTGPTGPSAGTNPSYGPVGGGGGYYGGMPGPGMGGPAPSAGGEIHHSMDVQKAIVGKIIGKGGETIQLIQRKSSCRVRVEQDVPEGYPCKVTMVGLPHNIGLASSMVQEIIMGVHTAKIGENLPPPIGPSGTPLAGAVPGPAYGGGGMPGPYGMPSPYGMPGPAQPYGFGGSYPPYGGNYGGMPAAAPGYGAPGPYGSGAPYGGVSHSGYPATAHAYSSAAATAVAPVKVPPVANNWTEYKDDEGRTYWHNSQTGTSQVCSLCYLFGYCFKLFMRLQAICIELYIELCIHMKSFCFYSGKNLQEYNYLRNCGRKSLRLLGNSLYFIELFQLDLLVLTEVFFFFFFFKCC